MFSNAKTSDRADLEDYGLDFSEFGPGAGEGTSPAHADLFSGDAYRERDDCTRGVSMEHHLPCDVLLTKPEMKFLNLLGEFDDFVEHDSEIKTDDLEPPEFHNSTVPVEMPVEWIGNTWLSPNTTSAAEAASRAYTFLTTEVCGLMVKVRREKLAMKAEVFVDVGGILLNCLVKVRICRSEVKPGQSSLLLLFSRFSGDSIAFSRVFSLASAFFSVEGSRCTNAQCPRPRPQLRQDFVSVQPLLDMVMDSSPQHQTEALAALAGLATTAETASALCAALAPVSCVIGNFLEDAEPKAAFLAALLAWRLTVSPNAGPQERARLPSAEEILSPSSSGRKRSSLPKLRASFLEAVQQDSTP